MDEMMDVGLNIMNVASEPGGWISDGKDSSLGLSEDASQHTIGAVAGVP